MGETESGKSKKGRRRTRHRSRTPTSTTSAATHSEQLETKIHDGSAQHNTQRVKKSVKRYRKVKHSRLPPSVRHQNFVKFIAVLLLLAFAIIIFLYVK